MKKIILLLFLAISLGCSKEDEVAKQSSCQCREEVQYYFIQDGITTITDHTSNLIPNTDCEANGTFTTLDTSFNGGVIRKETTIICE